MVVRLKAGDSPKVSWVDISSEYAGQRIDNFLFVYLKGVPKSKIYNILRKGEVRVNKGRVKALYKLCEGDRVRIPPVRVAEGTTQRIASGALERIKNTILFEDESMIVLDKPSGIAVHGGSGLSYGVIEALRQLRPDERGLELVHRIDLETSGCLLVAKKRAVLKELHRQLRERHVDKRYLALCIGKWPAWRKMVDVSLEKNVLRSGERVVRASMSGKKSATGFSVVESWPTASLIEATPITGRTHQIRVHALSAGHPLLGDKKYAYTNAAAEKYAKQIGLNRLFLHASAIAFIHPATGKPCSFTAPLSKELTQVLNVLREGSV